MIFATQALDDDLYSNIESQGGRNKKYPSAEERLKEIMLIEEGKKQVVKHLESLNPGYFSPFQARKLHGLQSLEGLKIDSFINYAPKIDLESSISLLKKGLSMTKIESEFNEFWKGMEKYLLKFMLKNIERYKKEADWMKGKLTDRIFDKFCVQAINDMEEEEIKLLNGRQILNMIIDEGYREKFVDKFFSLIELERKIECYLELEPYLCQDIADSFKEILKKKDQP